VVALDIAVEAVAAQAASAQELHWQLPQEPSTQ
jgi:hypothetical protein